MNAWQRLARMTTSALLVAVAASGLDAQGNTQPPLRPGQTKGPSFLVPVFKSNERGLGVTLADVVRNRMMSDYMITQLHIVPKTDIEGQLEASGYSKIEALGASDLRMLAGIVHAEEYLDGSVTRDSTNGTLTLQTWLMLPRQDGFIQPLPTVTGTRPGEPAAKVSQEVNKARKQNSHALNCISQWRQKKIEEAVLAGQRAIREYPNSVFGRICLLEIANSEKWGPDSTVKIAEEILAIHPENRRALVLVADAYQTKKMEDKYLTTLTRLLAADPTNANLTAAVVDALGAAGKPEIAKPIIVEAVRQNPGDPALIRLYWKILLALKDWNEAVTVGEEMIKTDTAAADTVFWQRLIQVYAADSQTQKASEAAARGAQKFPKHAGLLIAHAQLARQSGQLPQALEAINKVLAIDPKYPGAHFQKARIFIEMDQLDSLINTLRVAVAAGESKATAGGMLLPKANQMFQAYQRDTAKTVEQGERVMGVLAFADSLNSTETTSFLMGVTKMALGNALLQRAFEPKSCDDAKRANNELIDASTLVGKGGRAFPAVAGQVMQSLLTLQQSADRMVKSFCKAPKPSNR